MAVEHAPPGTRGFYGSWPQIGVPAGLLLSTAVFAVFSRLPEEQFLSWGWRVPFLLSVAARRRRAADPDADSRDAGVHQGERSVARSAPADRRSAAHVSEAGAAGDGRALRRERRVLHLQRLRAHLRDAAREDAAADRAERDPDRRAASSWSRFRSSARCRIGSDAGPCICSARSRRRCVAYPLFRLLDTGVASARVARADRRVRVLARARCTARRRRSSPSCSARASATAAHRSARSSRRCSPAACRRSSPRFSWRRLRHATRSSLYLIVMAAVTIVAVLLASETHRDHID